MIESGISTVTIEYEGHAAEINTRPITACLLEGLLSPLLSGVNMINAPILARDRSIDVSEVRHERDGEYQTLIRLTVETENRSRTVAGTLFGGDKPRIVEINGIELEAELGENMLVNKDRLDLSVGWEPPLAMRALILQHSSWAACRRAMLALIQSMAS